MNVCIRNEERCKFDPVSFNALKIEASKYKVEKKK
jgi:hypothetical protein